MCSRIDTEQHPVACTDSMEQPIHNSDDSVEFQREYTSSTTTQLSSVYVDDDLDPGKDAAHTQGEGTADAGDQLIPDGPDISSPSQDRDPLPASATNDTSRLPAAAHLPTDEATAQADSEDTINSLVKKAITECLASDKVNNPVEMLRNLQTLVITGRQLDITEEADSLEGETNFIMIKRGEILKTAFDELKGCQTEELRRTLEVKFHGEVS